MPRMKRIRLAIIFCLIFGAGTYSYAGGKGFMNIRNEERLVSLKTEFRSKVDILLIWAKENFKNDITIACTYRSPEEQDRLYRMGSTKTTLKGGQSKHQHGLAVDIYFIKDNKIVPYNNDYLRLGKKAEELDLIWGGSWTVPFDPGHFESKESIKEMK